jgi:hypothetical protein
MCPGLEASNGKVAVEPFRCCGAWMGPNPIVLYTWIGRGSGLPQQTVAFIRVSYHFVRKNTITMQAEGFVKLLTRPFGVLEGAGAYEQPSFRTLGFCCAVSC